MGLFDLNNRSDSGDAGRIPPGQIETKKFPVLSYLPTPTFDPDTWDFSITGAVEHELSWSWDEFLALPYSELTADFHCVTTWSRLDNEWGGVLLKDLLASAQPDANAMHIMAHCTEGYATNVPLEKAMLPDAILAYKHDGETLDADHGGPLRLVIPSLYAWKSAKWVRRIEVMVDDRPGFWEQNGYHNDADPWNEERYSNF